MYVRDVCDELIGCATEKNTREDQTTEGVERRGERVVETVVIELFGGVLRS